MKKKTGNALICVIVSLNLCNLFNLIMAKNLINKRIDTLALFLPELKELFEKKDFAQAKQLLKNIPSMDIAEGFKLLDSQQKLLVFKLLSSKMAIEVFENLKFDSQHFLLNNLGNQEVSQILNEMASDERAKLFKDLPEKVVKKFFSLMRQEEAEDLRKLLKYPQGTAGGLMTTEFVELKENMTARKALLKLQEEYKPGQLENIYSVYVADEEHRLIGNVSLQMLLLAAPDSLVKDIMSNADWIKIDVNTKQNEVAKHFSKYDLLDAPVVNGDNRLLGIITVDDIVDVIHRQTTKEFYEIGKMTSGEGELIRYSQVDSFDLVRRRAGWLVFLLIIDFLTGTVLKTFEHALSSVVALSFFIPMLLDTGGNAGAQTSITIIRGLATGDVTYRNAWRIVRIEALAAISMGLIVGVVAFLRAFLLQQTFLLALTVGLTMVVIVLLAISTGVILPLISKRFGLDPAVLAGPITTSIVDVIGLIIYFKIAQFLLPILRV